LDRIDAFPKNQRFIFGQRMADLALGMVSSQCESVAGFYPLWDGCGFEDSVAGIPTKTVSGK
jgi:hypothetical protein